MSPRALLVTFVPLCALLLAGCKEKQPAAPQLATLDQRTEGQAPTALTRELLERYAKYREAYAEIVAEAKRKQREERPEGAPDLAGIPAEVTRGVIEKAEAAREAAGLTSEQVKSCQDLVSIVVTSGLVIEDKLERLGRDAKLKEQDSEALARIQESIALYEEQKAKVAERIAQARKSYGKEAIDLVDDLRDVLTAAEKKVIEAGR